MDAPVTIAVRNQCGFGHANERQPVDAPGTAAGPAITELPRRPHGVVGPTTTSTTTAGGRLTNPPVGISLGPNSNPATDPSLVLNLPTIANASLEYRTLIACQRELQRLRNLVSSQQKRVNGKYSSVYSPASLEGHKNDLGDSASSSKSRKTGRRRGQTGRN